MPNLKFLPPRSRWSLITAFSALCLVAAGLCSGSAVAGIHWPAASSVGRHVPVGHTGLSRRPVTKQEISVAHQGENFAITLYQPEPASPNSPAVVFLPGLMAAVDQYESYAQALAARGFIVAVHDWYSPLTSDLELARDAKLLSDWLVVVLRADRSRIGIAGHSMGAKDAMLSAGQYGGFAGIVAIDPDDSGDVSVVSDYVGRLVSPLLLIGAEVAWKAPSICAPVEANYQRFFEHAPPGTVELTLRDADHVQMLDEPDRFGYTICRCGTADSRRVHDTALTATVGFFVQHLQGGKAVSEPQADAGAIRIARGALSERSQAGRALRLAQQAMPANH